MVSNACGHTDERLDSSLDRSHNRLSRIKSKNLEEFSQSLLQLVRRGFRLYSIPSTCSTDMSTTISARIGRGDDEDVIFPSLCWYVPQKYTRCWLFMHGRVATKWEVGQLQSFEIRQPVVTPRQNEKSKSTTTTHLSQYHLSSHIFCFGISILVTQFNFLWSSTSIFSPRFVDHLSPDL
ncbi:hypothetical protein IV203_016315 [Nitzschia inconspicua]|uniref:Uncharacterized protein n=1 Tax=Nitzschia inconspicua TaxID=303405 RepID=A0A9K3KR47_9STRA|nr:hypothetical protein IV203_016315 [Nitzschia inconspicua]